MNETNFGAVLMETPWNAATSKDPILEVELTYGSGFDTLSGHVV